MAPFGSGRFAFWWGVAFLAAAVLFPIPSVVDFMTKLLPRWVLAIWCLCVAIILMYWGWTRWKITGDPNDARVGQDTAAFVIAILAATFALLDLYKH